jgi:tRNA pseudouridine(55) synthase
LKDRKALKQRHELRLLSKKIQHHRKLVKKMMMKNLNGQKLTLLFSKQLTFTRYLNCFAYRNKHVKTELEKDTSKETIKHNTKEKTNNRNIFQNLFNSIEDAKGDSQCFVSPFDQSEHKIAGNNKLMQRNPSKQKNTTKQPTIIAKKSVFSFIPLSSWSFDNLLIPIDKPTYYTSHDVVRIIKRMFNLNKAGHSGTLDPNASGLMLIACNGATKRLNEFSEADKTYEFVVRFGEITDSMDADTEVKEVQPDNLQKCKQLTVERIRQVVNEKFSNCINQQVPLYSAIKIGGKRLYKIAHMKDSVTKQEKIQSIELPVREITIHKLDVLEKSPNDDPRDFKMVVTCSKGTYVRVLGNDIARECGFIGGHIVKLRRLGIAKVSVDCAWKLEELAALPGANPIKIKGKGQTKDEKK